MAHLVGTALRVVYVTVPDEKVGLMISRAIVGAKLAACVNIVDGVKSVYEWEGAVHESKEQLLIIKTQEGRLEELRHEVIRMHPYGVPEFISLPVDHSAEPYAKWVLEQTTKNDEGKH